MILYGPHLLLRPSRAWPATIEKHHDKSAYWLISAALTAAMWPAIAVVLGHLASAALGFEEPLIAVLRASVGFMAVVGGALIIAPALTLVLMSLAKKSNETANSEKASLMAMGVVWPTWMAGVVLFIPPLIGQGPEPGEIIWLLLAAAVATRTLRKNVMPSLGIRRRWAKSFLSRATATFLLLFILVAVLPSMITRAMLGAATVLPPSETEHRAMPLPPNPNW